MPEGEGIREVVGDKGYHSNQVMMDLEAVGVRGRDLALCCEPRNCGTQQEATRPGGIVMVSLEPDVTAAFLEFSRWKLVDQYWPRLRECVESLTEEQVWWRPNEASNSVGNLVPHLNGNVRQWLLASFNQRGDTRDRPTEFAQRAVIPPASLIQALGSTIEEASSVLSRLTETDLRTTFHIQGYTVTGVHAVYHVVEHFGMHCGQIIYVTKLLRGDDLGFYRELDKTGRAE